MDLIIYKYPNDNKPQFLRPILLFYIEANLQNKHIGRHSIKDYEELEGLSPEQYGIRSSKAEDFQALNKRLLYNLIRLKRIPATSVFTYLVSNYDLVLQSIA